MEGRFTVNVENEEIIISPNSNTVVSDRQQDFIMDVEKTIVVIKGLYYNNSKKTFDKFFDQIYKLTQVGLVIEYPQLELSKKALIQIKSEILQKESTAIKNKYLIDLGRFALIFFFVFIALYTLIKVILFNFPVLYITLGIPENLLLLLSGSTIGVWLSATISKTKIDFEDLVFINSNQLMPNLKLIFSSLICFSFGLLFYTELVVIKVGDISTKEIYTNPFLAIIFGIMLGINERLFGDSLIKKSEQIIKV